MGSAGPVKPRRTETHASDASLAVLGVSNMLHLSQVFIRSRFERPNTSAGGLRSAGGEQPAEPTVRGPASQPCLAALTARVPPN